MSAELTQAKALVFRVTHKNNVAWALGNGVECSNSTRKDPNFVSIGNPDLIAKRPNRTVPPDNATNLGDYVPFYFTPFSPMMYNMHTGWNGIQKRQNNEIVIIVTSLHKLRQEAVDFLFKDRHAYLKTAQFFTTLDDLMHVDWNILQKRDFKYDPEDPGKLDRYMAEALVRGCVPISALLGFACFDAATQTMINNAMPAAAENLKVIVKPGWYF